jgi:hypothetical protein
LQKDRDGILYVQHSLTSVSFAFVFADSNSQAANNSRRIRTAVLSRSASELAATYFHFPLHGREMEESKRTLVYPADTKKPFQESNA